MGTILGIPFSGLVANYLGWVAVFYIEGSLAVLVVGAWLYFVYDSPSQHPRISTVEREFIESTAVKPSDKVSQFTSWSHPY